MLKRTINYEDFDGNSVSSTHYFHFSKAELVELEASYDGGLEATIKQIVSAESTMELITIFKKIIMDSYGVRVDSQRFVKNDEVRTAFMESPAYSALFMELATDADAAATFMNGVLPKDLVEEAAQLKPATLPPPVGEA